MAMSAGNRGAQMNVTPMIDILLVLLIIFMVLIPTSEVGLDAHIPQPSNVNIEDTSQKDVVLTVHADRSIEVNHESVRAADVESRLRELSFMRSNQVVFVRADPAAKDTLDFATVAHVIDVAHGVGLSRVALMKSDQ